MSKSILTNHKNPLLTSFAKYLADRTPEQRRQGLIDAGILTKKGNVAKAYRSVIVSKRHQTAKSS